MSSVPTVTELQAASPPPKTRDNLEQKFPSVALIGAGGAGINSVKSFLKEGYQFDEPVRIQVIDTSLSNVNGLDESIEFHEITNLGSGKDRSKNFDIIKEFLDTHIELTKKAADITVIAFALGGGSGSVIGPLLAQKILYNSDKAVLLIGIIDQSSERDCLNSINTLKTLSGLAQEYNLYLPIILFSNKLAGRFAVNKTIVKRIYQFIDMMTNRSIEEFDFNDKLSFQRGRVNNDSSTLKGLYLFSITDRSAEEAKGEVEVVLKPNTQVHAVVSIDDVGDAPKVLASISYFGYSEDRQYTAVTGLEIPKDILSDLKETQERFRDAVSAKDKTTEQLTIDKEHDSNAGIVL